MNRLLSLLLLLPISACAEGFGPFATAPAGAAGGGLSGSYPNPTVAALPAISGANLTSLTGANVTGNITGNAASAAPSGSAGGNLSGSYPNPTVGSLGAVSASGTLTTTANPGYSISNSPVFGEIATVATAARARVIIKASASDASRLGQIILAPGNINTLFVSTVSASIIVNQTNLIGNVAGDTMLNMSPGSFGNTWTLNAYDSDGSLSVSDGSNDVVTVAQGVGAQTLSLDPSGANVRSGDAAVTTQGNGLVLRATTGATCWRVTVTSLGVLTTASVTCP